MNWLSKIKDKYNACIANSFLITGNIADYPAPGKTFEQYLVNRLSNDLKTDEVYTYDIHEGVQLVSNNDYGQEHSEINSNLLIDALEIILKKSQEKTAITLIIKYPDFIFDTQHGKDRMSNKRELLALLKVLESPIFASSNNMVFILSETKSQVPEELLGSNSRLLPVNVNYPNLLERKVFIDYLRKSSRQDIEMGIDAKTFANLTAGLSRKDIEDIYLMAEVNGTLSTNMIMDRKSELIQKTYGELIEVFDSTKLSLEDYGGQEHIKEMFKKDIIKHIKSGNKEAVPTGLLETGAPGTGKTYLAKCLAGSAGINAMELKLSKILNKYVGNTESNLEKVFNCFTSMSPVIVFIDEIDQALSRGENDMNTVQSNVFGMFLAFMSDNDNRGNILFIGATNYPNKMDEALKRTGRFDVKVPFFTPTSKEREMVFKVHLNAKKYKYTVSSEDLKNLAKKTNGYTQAEIEGIVVKAIQIARRNDIQVIDYDLLVQAINTIYHTDNDKIFEMSVLALKESNDADYLSPRFKKVKDKMLEDEKQGIALLREELNK